MTPGLTEHLHTISTLILLALDHPERAPTHLHEATARLWLLSLSLAQIDRERLHA